MAGKKFTVKGSNNSGQGLPVHRKTSQSLKGGNALESDHSRTRTGGRGEMPGTATARHYSITPSSSSGTIGTGQPLKTNRGGKEYNSSTEPIRRETKSAKPKR